MLKSGRSEDDGSITTSQLRILDTSRQDASEVNVDQKILIAADLKNTTSEQVDFTYLLQIQDSNGQTVSLSWMTGDLTSNGSITPKLGWTPDEAGEYTVTTFFWEGVDDPTALSPPQTINISVK